MISSISVQDLAECLERVRGDLETLRDGRILITGGTGFLGTWLLATLLYADDQLKLRIRVVVVCRHPDAFMARCPDLAGHRAVELIAGDVRYPLPIFGQITHVIHAANEVSAQVSRKSPLDHLAVIVDGTRTVLEHAKAAGAERTLLLSSGSVYGRQPPEITNLPEEFAGGLDPFNPEAAYHEGKRVAELMTAVYAQRMALPGVVVARIFSLIGPWMPQEAQFAAGNFIRDGLLKRPIKVTGDGRTLRSYLYAGDCVAWLWTLLVRGRHSVAYQVGSPDPISTGDLAGIIARAFVPTLPVEVLDRVIHSSSPHCYVPSAERAQREFGLRAWTNLDEAVRRTVVWSQQRLGHTK